MLGAVPLRWRLALATTVVMAVALAVVLAAVNALAEQVLIDNTARSMEVEAGLIGAGSGGASDGVAVADLTAGELAAAFSLQRTAVVVVDGDGRLIASEANGAPDAVEAIRLPAATYARIVAGQQLVKEVVALSDGSGRALVVAAPVRITVGTATATGTPAPGSTAQPGVGQGRGLGQGRGRGLGPPLERRTDVVANAVAQLGVSLETIDATLASLRVLTLTVGLVVLALAVAVVFLVTDLGLRPLRRVVEAADRVAAGDLSARSRLGGGHDEIGRLGRAFDEMIERLDAAFRAQRQFAADASHELRSPLTVLGGYVDVLNRGLLGADSATGHILGAMRREIDRLSRLAADLLFLTQLEAGGGQLQPHRLDLSDLLADMAEAARAMGAPTVELERDGPLPVMADSDRLTQALMNLVDNAVRHTPPDGLVRLSARREVDSALVEVYNTGDPIPPAALPRIFDRFYRADRGQGAGHAGLGLAITRAIVDASGGRIAATSGADGTRITVRLPLAGADPQRLLI